MPDRTSTRSLGPLQVSSTEVVVRSRHHVVAMTADGIAGPEQVLPWADVIELRINTPVAPRWLSLTLNAISMVAPVDSGRLPLVAIIGTSRKLGYFQWDLGDPSEHHRASEINALDAMLVTLCETDRLELLGRPEAVRCLLDGASTCTSPVPMLAHRRVKRRIAPLLSKLP